MDKDINNPFETGQAEDDSCILCGQSVTDHHPNCEYYGMKQSPPPKPDTLESLEESLKELESAPSPDFEAIMGVSRKIEEFRKKLVAADRKSEHEKSFDDWATGTSMHMLDPDQYGDGPAFVAPSPPPKPKQVLPKPESKSDDRLTGHLEIVKHALAMDVLRSAYAFLTHNGRDRLEDVISQTRTKQKSIGKLLGQQVGKTLKEDVTGLWQEEMRAKHLEQFKNTIRHGFERVLKEQNVLGKLRQDVLYHVVKELKENFVEIEKKDPGAVVRMQAILSREFLTKEQIARLLGKPLPPRTKKK